MSVDTSKKNKRASIILDSLHKGKSATSLSRAFCLNKATIRTIKRNDGHIRRSVASETELSKLSYTRDMIQEKKKKKHTSRW